MSAARPILIIEDDDALRLVLADQIAASGVFHPTTAATLEEARRRFATSDAWRFDAIILDIGLPDGDGRDFCTEIRSHGHMMPIIMLTGAADENDIVSGLNAGANDYMVKPFRTTELLARLQAQLRRFDTSEGAVFTIGPYIFRPSGKAADQDGDQAAHPPDQQGGGYPPILSPKRQPHRVAPDADGGGVGLQCQR